MHQYWYRYWVLILAEDKAISLIYPAAYLYFCITKHSINGLQLGMFSVNRLTKKISVNRFSVFTAQCTLVQSTVLGSHVVRPSVALVDCDHIGWKSWKLIARTISPTPSLFVATRRSTYSQGNMGKF